MVQISYTTPTRGISHYTTVLVEYNLYLYHSEGHLLLIVTSSILCLVYTTGGAFDLYGFHSTNLPQTVGSRYTVWSLDSRSTSERLVYWI